MVWFAGATPDYARKYLGISLLLSLSCTTGWSTSSQLERFSVLSQEFDGSDEERRSLLLKVKTRSTTTRDRNLQFRGAVSTGISEFSPVDFFLVLQVYSASRCNLVRKLPQNVEKIARFPGGEKSVESCHVSGCHGFFRSRIRRGVIYCAGKILPRIIVPELIRQGNSAACYVEKPRLGASGVKNDARESHRNSFPTGQFQNYPTKSFLNQLGNHLGYNGSLKKGPKSR